MNIIKPFTRYLLTLSPSLEDQTNQSNKLNRINSILLKQPLPITRKFNLPVPLQRNRVRSYASMSSPSIKLNSGHQMPLVGFG